ncbi:uncharacterized protein LOC119681148 [Teleopsis dalmanni]|uniref:uncharacterized protein LOC119681019 n=1 Tax=Teleopsis dalmanni TaxID=139649 RepID=UPI0018CE357B|nr:uncharacterized protein LOC119681019 [Teleopsis dalmanni]XP_037950178.1 uncharacterized protein LOC119681148 [Teleopsis dalmanni]
MFKLASKDMLRLPLSLIAKRCLSCNALHNNTSVLSAVSGTLIRDQLHKPSIFATSKRFMAVCGGDCPAKSDLCKFFKKQKKAPKKSKPKVEKAKFKSMWENPPCCIRVCILPKRFDELYYMPKTKAERRYTQTWRECPREIKPFKRCEVVYQCEDIILRDPLCKPMTAKPKDMEKFMASRNFKCPKMKLTECRPARNPPRCQKTRSPTDCKKVNCPVKSFSECLKPPFKKLRPVECQCLRASSCDAHNYFIQKNKK